MAFIVYVKNAIKNSTLVVFLKKAKIAYIYMRVSRTFVKNVDKTHELRQSE